MTINVNIPMSELCEMLDSYDINDLSILFHEFDDEIRITLVPYLIMRLKEHMGTL